MDSPGPMSSPNGAKMADGALAWYSDFSVSALPLDTHPTACENVI